MRGSEHIAHMNWGILKADWDDPQVAEFADSLDRVNAVAMRAPGFVWMMPEDEMDTAQNDPSGIFDGNPRTASTLSVWESAAALDAFVHKTVHGAFMARAGAWFVPQDTLQYVLWPIPAGHRPSLAEANERLRHLAAHGSSDVAFDFAYARARSDGEAAA